MHMQLSGKYNLLSAKRKGEQGNSAVKWESQRNDQTKTQKQGGVEVIGSYWKELLMVGQQHF